MSLLKISDILLKDIANAIRYKHNDERNLYYPRQYPDLINSIYDDRREYMHGVVNNQNAFCGNKVIDIGFAWYRKSVSGKAIVPDSVRYMPGAYAYSSVNEATCHDQIVTMNEAYMETKINHGVCGASVSEFAYTYFNCRQLETCDFSDSIVNMQFSLWGCSNYHGESFSGPLVTDMAEAFYNCQNMVGNPKCGPRVKNMWGTYYNCQSLTGNAIIAEKVTNAANAYSYCYNLDGTPSCGSRVIDLSNAYRNCGKLTGCAVIGEYTEEAPYAYYGCISLTKAAPSAPSLKNAYHLYYNCFRMSGELGYYPAVSGQIINMCYNCSSLTGFVKLSDAIYSMGQAFYNCSNITGAHIPSNLSNGYQAFRECKSLTFVELNCNRLTDMGNMFYNTKVSGDWYINTMPNAENGQVTVYYNTANMIFGRTTMCGQLNIHVKDPMLFKNIVQQPATTNSTGTYKYSNVRNLTGFNVRFTTLRDDSYAYNSTYKIYVYQE